MGTLLLPDFSLLIQENPPDLVTERPHQSVLIENPFLAIHPVLTLLIDACSSGGASSGLLGCLFLSQDSLGLSQVPAFAAITVLAVLHISKPCDGLETDEQGAN